MLLKQFTLRRSFLAKPQRAVRNARVSAVRVEAVKRDYFATCHPGLEDVLLRELVTTKEIRAQDVEKGRGGVYFSGPSAMTGVRAALWLRGAIRVLEFLHEGEIGSTGARTPADAVYDITREAGDWSKLLHMEGMTLTVQATLRNCDGLTNSMLVAARVRDAVCDSVRDATGLRPPPPARGAKVDMPLFVSAHNNRCIIYRDVGGGSLHRRGYRTGGIHRAALNEAAAAGLLRLAGFDEIAARVAADMSQGGGGYASGGHVAPLLVDPMMGSGTFLTEAALMLTNTAPGLLRFGHMRSGEVVGGPEASTASFTSWRDFDPRDYSEIVAEAFDAQRRPELFRGAMYGNELHPGAFGLAQNDMRAAGVDSLVTLTRGDAKDLTLPAPPQLVVCNPPWGNRLEGVESSSSYRPSFNRDNYADEEAEGAEEEVGGRAGSVSIRVDPEDDPGASSQLEETWKKLAYFLKTQCGDSTAYVLSGDPEATAFLRMKAERKHPVGLGGVDARFLKYQVLPPKPGSPLAAAPRAPFPEAAAAVEEEASPSRNAQEGAKGRILAPSFPAARAQPRDAEEQPGGRERERKFERPRGGRGYGGDRPSYDRERPSYDRERPSYDRERPSYGRSESDRSARAPRDFEPERYQARPDRPYRSQTGWEDGSGYDSDSKGERKYGARDGGPRRFSEDRGPKRGGGRGGGRGSSRGGRRGSY